MGRTRRPATAAPEAAQEAQERQDVSQNTQEQETTSEGVQEAAGAAQRIIGPDNPADLLGCEDGDADETELVEGSFVEYAVTAEGGLRLREGPSVKSPIIAVLPQGAGVLADGGPEDGWLHVRTGRLEGWMMAKHLDPIALPELAAYAAG